MKRLLLLIPVLIFLMNCVSSNDLLSEQEQTLIKKNSDTSIAYFNKPLIIKDLVKTLSLEGHRVISQENPIITDPRDIGQSTQARFTIFIDSNTLIATADWGAGYEAQIMASSMSGVNASNSTLDIARWSEGRPKRAFASLYKFIKNLNPEKIETVIKR